MIEALTQAQKAQLSITALASIGDPYNETYPLVHVVDRRSVYHEVQDLIGTPSVDSPIIDRELQQLNCVEFYPFSAIGRTFQGTKNDPRCQGCYLDMRCPPQGTADIWTEDATTGIEESTNAYIRKTFDLDTAFSMREWIVELATMRVEFQVDYDRFNDLYSAVMRRIEDLPVNTLYTQLKLELQAIRIAQQFRIGEYKYANQNQTAYGPGSEMSELIYFLRYFGNMTFCQIRSIVGEEMPSQEFFYARWKEEGKQILANTSMNSFAIWQLFIAYINYLKGEGNVQTMAQDLSLTKTALRGKNGVFARFGLIAKGNADFRMKFLELGRSDDGIKKWLNVFWTNDQSLTSHQRSGSLPYSVPRMMKEFRRLIENYGSETALSIEEFDRYASCVGSKRDSYSKHSLQDVIGWWQLHRRNGITLKEIALRENVLSGHVVQTLIKLGLPAGRRNGSNQSESNEVFNLLDRSGQRVIMTRYCGEYALVNTGTFDYVPIQKRAYMILKALWDNPEQSGDEIHFYIHPFPQIPGYTRKDYIKIVNQTYKQLLFLGVSLKIQDSKLVF